MRSGTFIACGPRWAAATPNRFRGLRRRQRYHPGRCGDQFAHHFLSATSELVLDWTDASGETGYRIERSLNGTSGWTTVGTVGKNVPMFNNTGLTVGTQYYYRVVTLDGSGDAATSTVVTNFTRLAVVSGLAFDSILYGTMTFHWTAVTNATSYRIERSTDGGATYAVLASNVTATTYTDSGLTALQEYYYRVTAVNSYTESSGPSAAIHAIAPTSNLAPPWVTQDIGAVGLVGSAGYSGGTFTLIGSGARYLGQQRRIPLRVSTARRRRLDHRPSRLPARQPTAGRRPA